MLTLDGLPLAPGSRLRLELDGVVLWEGVVSEDRVLMESGGALLLENWGALLLEVTAEPWSDGTLWTDGTGWLGPQDIGGNDAPAD